MANETCANCGMEQEDWSVSEGVPDDEGELHCCEGCAQDDECICPEPLPSGEDAEQGRKLLDEAMVEREGMLAPAAPSAADGGEGFPSEDEELPADRQMSYKRQPDGPAGVTDPSGDIEEEPGLTGEANPAETGDPLTERPKEKRRGQ